MNIDNLRNALNDVEVGNFGSVSMKLVQKVRDGYEVYQPTLQDEMKRDLKQMYVEVLNSPFYEYQQAVYNPNVVEEESIPCGDLTVANAGEILEEIENGERHGNLHELELERINFYYIKFQVNNEEIYIFKRFNKLKKIRNGLFGFIEDNTFHRIENGDFYSIDRDIDIIIYQNEMLIINRFALQTIFNLQDYFYQKTIEALDYLENQDVIENFHEFREDCLNDRLASRRMTKIVATEGRLEGFVRNQDLLPTIINEAALNIELNENGNIIYNSDRETRSQILYCLADAYYRSMLLNRIAEDIAQ